MSQPRRLAVMQPTYLPWLGWFDLMDQCDDFVLLDDVPFSRQSWQQRNRIRTQNGLQWLTVAVRTRGRLGELLQDVRLTDASIIDKHLRTIQMAYARAPHLQPTLDELAEAMARGVGSGRLVDLNTCVIDLHRRWLGITTEVHVASAMAVLGDRVARLVAMCVEFGATEYVTVPGTLDYLDDEAVGQFAAAGIRVLVQQYEHPSYPQLHGEFLSHAAAVDAVLQTGDGAREIMRSGRREPTVLEAGAHG